MDKASDFESEDCEFESRRGRMYFRENSLNGQNKQVCKTNTTQVVGEHAWL